MGTKVTRTLIQNIDPSQINAGGATAGQVLGYGAHGWGPVDALASAAGGIPGGVGGGQGIAIFDVPGTYSWTAPLGVYRVTIELYGAGGGVADTIDHLRGRDGGFSSCSIGGKTVKAMGGQGGFTYGTGLQSGEDRFSGGTGGSVPAVAADASLGFSGVGEGIGGLGQGRLMPVAIDSHIMIRRLIFAAQDGRGSRGGYGGGGGGVGTGNINLIVPGGLGGVGTGNINLIVPGGLGGGCGTGRGVSGENGDMALTTYSFIAGTRSGSGGGGVGGGTAVLIQQRVAATNGVLHFFKNGGTGWGYGGGALVEDGRSGGGGGGGHAVYCINVTPGATYSNSIVVGQGGQMHRANNEGSAGHGAHGAVVIRF